MNLAQSIETLTSTNEVTIAREEKAWVARYASNNHVIRKFTNGYDVVHAAMYMTEKGKDAKEVLKSDEYNDWFNDRKVANSKAHGLVSKSWHKSRIKLAEDLLALDNYDSIVDMLHAVITESSQALQPVAEA